MTARPVNRVFGSKARVAERIISLVPRATQVWCEVFAGSAAITMTKEPHPIEHLNDLNGDVTNLFEVLRDPAGCERLCRLIDLTPWAEREMHFSYSNPRSGDPVEDARCYLVRSWMTMGAKQEGRSGWHRETNNNSASSRIGTWQRLPRRIAIAARRLKQVYIHNLPGSEIIAAFGRHSDACLFVDPPYPKGAIATHCNVYSITMTEGEHAALAEQLRGVTAAVILTMAPATIYDDVLRDWRCFDLEVRGLRNTKKIERIFCNFDPPEVSLFDHADARIAMVAL